MTPSIWQPDARLWQPYARHNGALVSALVFDGRLADRYVNEIAELLDIWAARLPGNLLRRRYYEGLNVLKDLGIAIPPPLRNIETVVGWPKKAVSAVASRSRFDGFTAPGSDEVQGRLDSLVRRCALKRKYKQAVESELISGCDFITLSKGDEGEPPVIVTTHSAEDCAARWDGRLGRIRDGLVIMHYDRSGSPDEVALYDSERTLHVDARGDGIVIESMGHRMGRPLMEAMAYNPTEAKPLGQSRITRAVRSITDSGVREALRTEISAEFFTSPQKYLLGTDYGNDPFESKTRWEAYIGNIFEVTQNEDGSTPSFGQLSQGSMQPHTDYMRSLAARFSGETNVPVSQLGVIHDNPSSADAINQANEPLIMEVQDLNDGNNDSLVSIVKMALAIESGNGPDAYEDVEIVANFRNPLMPSVASQADAMVKIAGVVPEFAQTEVFWEMIGFSDDMRKRVVREMAANAGRTLINQVMGGAVPAGSTSPALPSAASGASALPAATEPEVTV